MQMSNRISAFQCSPIRRLVPYSREAEEKGTHVIHLNIGQPDIKTPKEALDAIHNYDQDIIEYGRSEGEVGVRRGLVKYYKKYGIEVDEDDIMITTGGSEAIQFIFMTLCDPYDEFIIPEPYYTNVATFANIAMVTLRPVTSSPDNNFALPSIEEFEKKINNVICTSATPGDYELSKIDGKPVEQIIRPTGLLDPIIEVRSNSNNPIYDLMEEIKKRIERDERVLVVTLTVKDAENLTDFLKEHDFKVAYLQHEILTLQRTEIIYKLRKGIYQVVVGINLLREGLDIPEVSLIAILDADREGFLRSTRSLTQIVGRAARNANGKVIMYCDKISDAMQATIEETKRRRSIQEQYNKEHGIVPKTIVKPIQQPIKMIDDESKTRKNSEGKMTRKEMERQIKEWTKEMNQASKELDFERAAQLRDAILELKAKLA